MALRNRNRPPAPLLTEAAFRAVLSTWNDRQIKIGNTISGLPIQDGADAFGAWGFVFAIDYLGTSNTAALEVLFNVMNELEVRPTYDEVFTLVTRLLVVKGEVIALCQNRDRHRGRPTPKFVRRS